MKDWQKHILLFLLIVGFMGALVAVSGIVNIAASSSHFRITAWLLEFGKRRYVTTYTLMTKIPTLDDSAMVMRGAGHYEIGCRQCHGGPEEPHLLGEKMTPKSPFLPPEIEKYSDDELFRIVKHGIKFTGMPAWPDLNRDDEVWSMVAFLKKLPQMTREDYRKMVYGKKEAFIIRPSAYSGEVADHILMTCNNCHGVDGNGRGDAFPKLAGQNKVYLANSLKAFKKGERHSGTMEMIAEALSEEMIQSISDYYSSRKRRRTAGGSLKLSDTEREEAIERGRKIAQEGIPEQKVAACIGCHGPLSGGGTQKPHFPDLRGQPSDYLSNQLRLFIEDKRGGSEHQDVMKKAVIELNEVQRMDVALFYESLLHETENNHPSEINNQN